MTHTIGVHATTANVSYAVIPHTTQLILDCLRPLVLRNALISHHSFGGSIPRLIGISTLVKFRDTVNCLLPNLWIGLGIHIQRIFYG